MAEPVSALPDTTLPDITPPDSPTRTQPVPWPKTAQMLPELSETTASGSDMDFGVRLRSAFDRSYREVGDALVSARDHARRAYRYVAEEHPLKLVIGVAAAGFIAGVALRIWRSNHD